MREGNLLGWKNSEKNLKTKNEIHKRSCKEMMKVKKKLPEMKGEYKWSKFRLKRR